MKPKRKYTWKDNQVKSRCEALYIDRLLEDTPEAWYWVGFLLADGSIDHNNKRIKLTLSNKDANHLHKFNEFIGNIKTYKYKDYIEIKVRHTQVISKLINKFNFKPRKTYDPPHMSHRVDELLISLYAGFIDGDGHIGKIKNRNHFNLAVKLHISWFNWLYEMEKNLYYFFDVSEYHIHPKVRVNKKGYASLIISDNELIRKIKEHTMRYSLPVLDRKWGEINISTVSRYILASKRKKYVLDNQNKKTITEMAANLKVSNAAIYKIIKRAIL